MATRDREEQGKRPAEEAEAASDARKAGEEEAGEEKSGARRGGDDVLAEQIRASGEAIRRGEISDYPEEHIGQVGQTQGGIHDATHKPSILDPHLDEG
jgi:hypothetical protein